MSASVILSAPAMSLTALGLRSVGVSSGAVRRCLVALVVMGRLLPVACTHHPAIWSAVTISRKRSRVRDDRARGHSRAGYKESTPNGKRTGPIDYACAFLAGVATLRGCSPFPSGGASRCRSWAIIDQRKQNGTIPTADGDGSWPKTHGFARYGADFTPWWFDGSSQSLFCPSAPDH